jgi:hypothetical protein
MVFEEFALNGTINVSFKLTTMTCKELKFKFDGKETINYDGIKEIDIYK